LIDGQIDTRLARLSSLIEAGMMFAAPIRSSKELQSPERVGEHPDLIILDLPTAAGGLQVV
jgi:hypothetical protein